MTPLDRLATVFADRYRIDRQLGEGGMATVYLAHDLKHDRDVALKVLKPELAAILGRERFLNEIRLTARLDHPHIVTLIDSGETDGLLWYVLPFIRGESLRARLQREKQLGVEEALAVARQIASALDYAHGKGVIHRDLKPENVLLHEGEAMLADFGIALAVKEAGGSRLTETGLSLGTPSYMSPEQATGDRVLDARSDVYSLGAVIYEMLAGEPPHSGATVQAVIAKLMTERPTRLRTVRDTVPEGVDAAVARALAKVPADRFESAGEFAAQLKADASGATRPRSKRFARWATAAAVLVLGVGAALVASRRAPPAARPTPVRMTNSGDVSAVGLSADGTRLATSVKECDSNGRCTFALVWRELGGGGQLRIAERLGSLRLILWSSDSRHVIYQGTDSAGRYGGFRVSALGGPARFLGCCGAQFLGSADTLLLLTAESGRATLRVIGLPDGAVRDSIGLPYENAAVATSPDGQSIAALVPMSGSQQLLILDRRLRRIDSLVVPRTVTGSPRWDPRSDAVLLASLTSESSPVSQLLRVPLDRRRRLGAPAPVEGIAISDLGTFSVVGRSRTLTYLAGGQEWSVHALTRDDPGSLTFRGRPIRRATGELQAALSPDGRFIAILFREADSPRVLGTIVPFDGGPETPLPAAEDEMISMEWGWSSTHLLYITRGKDGTRTLHRFDPASGRARVLGPSPNRGFLSSVGPGALAWIDDSSHSVVLADSNGRERRRIPDPDRSEQFGFVIGSPDGRRLFTVRWNPGFDSLRFAVLDPATGSRKPAGAIRVEDPSGIWWAPDGSIQFAVLETWGTLAFYRLDPDRGRINRLGAFPAEGLQFYAFSRDGRRAVKLETRPRGDAWMVPNFDGQGVVAAAEDR